MRTKEPIFWTKLKAMDDKVGEGMRKLNAERGEKLKKLKYDYRKVK